MAKVLKISFPEKCTGCELCVFEVQRQLKKVGLDGAPIRIFNNRKDQSGLTELSFKIDIDPSINALNLEKIANICPTNVFTIEEVDVPEEGSLLN